MSLAGTLARKGAPATFSHLTTGSYDPLTGITTGTSTVTIAGNAMEIEGDADLYLQLGLIESNARTLLFRPTTTGSLPEMNWTVVWGGETLTVKHFSRLAMAGSPIAAKVVVAR